ncbi:hypothetical protein RRG08_013695 [Elysia crispata]|uniref:Uncharacterized protein n=1 Tax=Elysia crispata TaxID=231223 RepID=A0AAE0ZMH6_9GAST|nr:hypothetical protein RRG08_013695 [Elysia crispata]
MTSDILGKGKKGYNYNVRSDAIFTLEVRFTNMLHSYLNAKKSCSTDALNGAKRKLEASVTCSNRVLTLTLWSRPCPRDLRYL